jgi:glycerophosphoryl diester phosphodiesterase
MGRREILTLRAASLGAPTPRSAAGCTQVPVRQGRLRLVDRRFVEAAHRRGIGVHVWTIDDADEMGRLLDMGVDGIMTDRCEMGRLLDLGVDAILSDRPTVLKDVFTERGLWV